MDSKKQENVLEVWVRVLSFVALANARLPEGYDGSALTAAKVIIILTMLSKPIFKFFYVLFVIYMVVIVFMIPSLTIIGYTALYFLLGIVFFAQDERQRIGEGHFLSAVWWAGQFLLHFLNLLFVQRSRGELDLLSLLFCVLTGLLALKGIAIGSWRLYKARSNPCSAAGACDVRTDPPD